MKLSWSLISIISRFAAVGVGLVQSVIIVKLLSIGDYGLVGLVVSISAVVGVYQNLGISSGSTREIAAANNSKEAFKIFIGSLIVRYAISFPLVLGLYIFAPYIGIEIYQRHEIILPLRIFAIILFIQALQSVLNSVIQGLKKFKFLFIFQVVIAFVSIATFIPFLIGYGFIGYFYALLVFNVISTTVLGFYSARLFAGSIELPSRKELGQIIKAVFSIGLFVYVIKIVFMQWQKLGLIFLGRTLSDEMLGIFSFALLVASKISTISDAITDVTLPSMTKVFEKSKSQFREVFLKGNSKAYFLVMFSSVILILLKREIFQVVDVIFSSIGKDPITERYAEAFIIMDPMILAFWAYSHINLLKSGLAVPSRKLWGALFSYITMFIITVISFYLLRFDPLLGFSVAMGIGALIAYVLFIILIKRDVGFYPISKADMFYSLISAFVIGGYYLGYFNWVLAVVYLFFTYGFYKKSYFYHT